MTQFDNVSVERAANIYFDGKVTSRTLMLADGTRKTLGIMLPGDYEFSTDKKELMEITAGKLDVQLPEGEWQPITGGQSFEVPANASFKLRVSQTTDYCCSYLS